MLTGLLTEFNSDLPLITKMILGVSDAANTFGLYVIGILVVSVVSTLLYRKKPQGKLRSDLAILRMPMFGTMVQQSSLARVTQTLGSLLSSGITLLEAVELTRDSTDNAVLKNALEMARFDLLSGKNFSEALANNPIFPPMLVEVVRVGESAGNLADQLDVISKVLQQDFDTTLARMIGLIEPGMILVVGGVMGLVGITVISTVYSILPNID